MCREGRTMPSHAYRLIFASPLFVCLAFPTQVAAQFGMPGVGVGTGVRQDGSGTRGGGESSRSREQREERSRERGRNPGVGIDITIQTEQEIARQKKKDSGGEIRRTTKGGQENPRTHAAAASQDVKKQTVDEIDCVLIVQYPGDPKEEGKAQNKDFEESGKQ